MAWEYDKTNFDRNLAVVIGIDHYKSDSVHNLSTPVSDARALADLLETEYGYNKDEKGDRLFDENVVHLFDEAATLTGLQTLLTDTLPNQLKPTKSDRLIFYFAGHGIPRNSKDGPAGYLVPQDADWQKQDSFLSMSYVYEELSKLECHHLLVILDCCFAGTFRWAGRRKMIPILETVRREHYDRFIRYPAWQVITSAAHDQEALDVAKLAEDKRGAVRDEKQELHSPFALALLEGLRENKADLIQDGVITAHELYLYLEQQVSKLSGERQKPGIYPMRLEYDRGEFVFTKPGFNPFDPVTGLKPAPPLNEENNPYRGLKSFDERHARFFFGRKALVEELQRRLTKSRRPLTVVLGASGCGKSSLVKAGLLPHLRSKQEKDQQAQRWYILNPMRPGKSPFTELARAVLPVANSNLIAQLAQVSFLDKIFAEILDPKSEQKQKAASHNQTQPDSRERTSGDEAFDATKLAEFWNSATPEAKLLLVVDYFTQLQGFCHQPQEQEQLSNLYRAIERTLNPLSQAFQQEPQFFINLIVTWSQVNPTTKLLLVIDQFEELITMSQDAQKSGEQSHSQEQDEQKEWQRFLSLLRIALAKYHQQLHVVLTLRSDFEPRFLNSALKTHWKSARFPVRAMNSDELRDAIEGPALKQALYFEPPELVGMLIDEVGQMPGALPLLSFTLSELYVKLYERWKPGSTDRALRMKDYEELGGVAGALTCRATQEYDNLVRDFGEASGKAYQATMRRVILRMVTIEGGGVARRRVPESELVYPDAEENKRVVQVSDQLVKARLLVKGQETGEPYVEPAHDFLVRGWDKLQVWMKQEQENLALRQRLTAVANDWDKGEGALWVREPERLVQLEKVLKSHENWLNSLETRFVNESKSQRIRELEEAERQRDEAVQGQISALNSLSDARFRVNDQLGALIAALKAGQQLKHQASNAVRKQVYDQTISALREVISGIQEKNRFQQHSGIVWDINFSLDGRILASASYDKTVKIWHSDGTLAQNLEGHQADVVSVCFNHDGTILASGSYDKTVRLWHLDGVSLKRVIVLNGHTDHVTCVCFSPNEEIIVSASQDKTVRLWKADGSFLNTLKGLNMWVWDVKFHPKEPRIALACADKTIRLVNLNGTNLKIFRGHTDAVTSISFSPNGQLIASASADKTVRLWDVNGKLLKTLEGHQNYVWKVDFSFDNQLIASASWDNTVKLWKYDGTLLQTWQGHSNRVWSARFKPGSQEIASASADNSIRLWENKSPLLKTFEGHDGWVWDVSFSPDSQLIASASGDNTIKIWKRDGTLHQTLEEHEDLVDSISFMFDGQMVASASADKTVKLWQLRSGKFTLFKTLKEPEGHTHRVRGVEFNPKGGMFASASFDRTIKLWNSTGVLLNTLDEKKGGHSQEVIHVSFSLDGKWIASASYDRTVKLWDCNGKLHHTLEGHTDGVIAAAFSPDARLIASASDDKTVVLWRIEEEKITKFKVLVGHQDWVMAVSFSHDGRLIASASADHTIKLWSGFDGSLLTTLKGHSDWVLSVSFSHDNRILASAGADKTIKLWSLDDIELDMNLDQLLSRGYDWVRDYLHTNPNIREEDREIYQRL